MYEEDKKRRGVEKAAGHKQEVFPGCVTDAAPPNFYPAIKLDTTTF